MATIKSIVGYLETEVKRVKQLELLFADKKIPAPSAIDHEDVGWFMEWDDSASLHWEWKKGFSVYDENGTCVASNESINAVFPSLEKLLLKLKIGRE